MIKMVKTKIYTSNNSTIERAELSLYEPYQSIEIDRSILPKKYKGGLQAAKIIIDGLISDVNNEVPSQLTIWFNDGNGVHRRRFHLSKNWNITKQDGGYY